MGLDIRDDPSYGRFPAGPDKRAERKAIQCRLPPSHPEFERSFFSSDELIALLLFENKELQATLRKAETRVLALEKLLREHGIAFPKQARGVFENALDPVPVPDDVPQRTARRRLGSTSAQNNSLEKPEEPDKRTSVVSNTSNGLIDASSGVYISSDVKSELIAVSALDSEIPEETHMPALPATRPSTSNGGTTKVQAPLFRKLAADMHAPSLDHEPAFVPVAPHYVSPNLLQDEMVRSTPDASHPLVSDSGTCIRPHVAKQASESCLQASSSYRPRIRHPGIRTEDTDAHDELQSTEGATQHSVTDASEVSTIATRRSLHSSTEHSETLRDAKQKIPPNIPVLNTLDGLLASNPSYNDTVTLNSATLFDPSLPLSPVQRMQKSGHRDLFKIGNSLSLGSSESVSRMSNSANTPSFLVLSAAEDEDIPLFIKPKDFYTIRIKVVSTISVNAKKSDDPICTFSINDRESGKEMWRIRKSYSQIIQFDTEIRPVVEFFGLPPLPEKSLFNSFTPSKVKSRFRLLHDYFITIFNMPHIPQLVLMRICRYISLDCVNPLDDFKSGARKEGFLLRRYKGLGTTWKVRWCQVDGPALEIYELPGGALIEQIKLGGAQIGRQSADVVAKERGYCHALLIIESTRNSKISTSQPKHFFCAETDEERDSWISSMVEYTDNDPLQQDVRAACAWNESLPMKGGEFHDRTLDDGVPFKGLRDSTLDASQVREEKKMKKRSIFSLRSRVVSGDLVKAEAPASAVQPYDNMQTYLDQIDLQDEPAVRVFGLELVDAYRLSHREFKGLKIPSICFWCFDFLDRRGAIYEEGIFRVSGSTSAIRQLKQKFDDALDVDLFESPLAPDVHTVASLLKAYLRELPSLIFGEHTYIELQLLVKENAGVHAVSRLALMVRDHLRTSPHVNPINYDFCVVIFGFFRRVIAESSTNRMPMKNLCIVFVPTLNILVEILSLCLVDYDCIFGDAEPTPDHRREVLDLRIPTF